MTKAQQRSAKLQKRMESLAKRYYGTSNLHSLSSSQLDKVVGWTMNWTEDTGKNKSRKYQKAITGNTKYLNSSAQTKNILEKQHTPS